MGISVDPISYRIKVEVSGGQKTTTSCLANGTRVKRTYPLSVGSPSGQPLISTVFGKNSPLYTAGIKSMTCDPSTYNVQVFTRKRIFGSGRDKQITNGTVEAARKLFTLILKQGFKL